MPNEQNDETIPDESVMDEDALDDQTWPEHETLTERDDIILEPYSTATGPQ